MVIRGRVENGVVVLSDAQVLPEGADVSVVYPAAQPSAGNTALDKRVRLPLVPSKRPGTVNLTADRVAELLENDDFSP